MKRRIYVCVLPADHLLRLWLNSLFWTHCGSSHFFFLSSSSIEGEYVPVEGDEVSYKMCSIPPKFEAVQAVEVTITHLKPGTKHETWAGRVISSWRDSEDCDWVGGRGGGTLRVWEGGWWIFSSVVRTHNIPFSLNRPTAEMRQISDWIKGRNLPDLHASF